MVPAFAEKAEKVIMLQRSPTYFFCSENKNALADKLREGGAEEPVIHDLVRRHIMFNQDQLTQRCMAEPDTVFEELKELVRAFTETPDFQFEPHFTPRYRVWQQRLAFCPEGDVFRAAVSGKLEVVTDTIERFTPAGVRTSSGEEIEADIIIACTGFNLLVMGGIPFTVDGEAVDWSDTVTYRGAMHTGVPNSVWVMGYFRASWTLRVDMMGDFVCGLLNHMRNNGVSQVEVAFRPEDRGMEILPWIEDDNFNPGYLNRGIGAMPRRGDKAEWRHNQDYWAERDAFPAIDFDGSEFVYSGDAAFGIPNTPRAAVNA